LRSYGLSPEESVPADWFAAFHLLHFASSRSWQSTGCCSATHRSQH
jgi:hypothetical protein